MSELTEFEDYVLDLMLNILNSVSVRLEIDERHQKQIIKNQELIMINVLRDIIPPSSFYTFMQKYSDEQLRSLK